MLRVPYLDYGVGLGEIEVEAERWQVISKYTRDSEELETPLGVLHTSESACWVEDLWPPGRRNRQT